MKLKAMHWDKLDAQSSQYTIWSHMMLDANQLASLLKERGLLDEIERVFQHKESKLRFGGKSEKSGKKELMGTDLRQKFGIRNGFVYSNLYRGCVVRLPVFGSSGFCAESVAL